MSNSTSPALQMFLSEHRRDEGDQQRLGQRFLNKYAGRDSSLSKLFYERDEAKAQTMIKEWLDRHHYHYMLPSVSKSYLDPGR